MLILKPVSQKNWRLVTGLTVANDQTNFIESNKDSLLEAAFDKSLNWIPLALYDDENIIGFSMVGAFNEHQKYIWLDRFMIDKNFQNRGYGKLFLNKIISYISRKWDVNKIILSVHKDNEYVLHFYKKTGFVNTNEIDSLNGEIIMILEL